MTHNTILPISYPAEASDWCADLELSSFWFQHRNQCIVTLMNRFCFPNLIYDIGGGNGIVSLYLNRSNYKTVLIEPSSQAVIRAKKRGVVNTICESFEHVTLQPKSIPAFGMFDVLEHIEKPELWLKKISQGLIPNGLIIITVPAYKFAWSIDDNYAGHFRRYSLKQLSQDLETAGFEVVFISYFFTWLLLPLLWFRTIPTKLRLISKVEIKKQSNFHLTKSNWLRKIVLILLKPEIWFLSRAIKLPFGTSVIAIARLR